MAKYGVLVMLAIVMVSGGCKKKARYPGTNPFLPSVHQAKDITPPKQPQKPEANVQPGVIAVVNTPHKAYLAWIKPNNHIRHKAFSGIFTRDQNGDPLFWKVEKRVVKKIGKIHFPRPLIFEFVRVAGHSMLSGEGLLKDIKADIERHKKNAGYTPQWEYTGTITPFACALGTLTYLVKTKQYWPGAAHPDAVASLVTLDTKSFKKQTFAKRFSMRTLMKDATASKKLDKCINAFDSVIPLQGRGGRLQWVASFNHNYAYCSGMIDFRRVSPPPGFAQATNEPACTMDHGVLKDSEGHVIARSVWDWRASPDCSTVVFLEKLGPGDRFRLFPRPGTRSKRRNLYLWTMDSDKKVLLGRASRILCVEFPDHTPIKLYLKAAKIK